MEVYGDHHYLTTKTQLYLRTPGFFHQKINNCQEVEKVTFLL